MARRVHDEDGVVAIVVALLLPVLLAAGGFGLGTLLLTGGERELQRTTDAAALAAATSLPLADLTAGHRASATEAACRIAEGNLEAATIAQGFIDGAVASCENDLVTVTYESELADVVALQGTLNSLPGMLPPLAVPASVSVPLCATVTVLGQTVNACTTVIVTSDHDGGQVCGPAQVVVLGVTTTVQVCGIVSAPDPGQVALPVDLSDVAPALLTPRVRVQAEHALNNPLGRLIGEGVASSEVGAQAVARRRLKNAVFLVVEQCPGLEASLLSGGADATIVGHSVRMGELRVAVEAHCNLADPNTYADIVGEAGFGALDTVAARLAALLPEHGAVPGCLLGGVHQDLLDVYDPPAGGPAPTGWDVLQSAALADEDIMVIVAGVVGTLSIPVFDMIAVPASDVQAGSLANVREWPTARGVFRASLVDEQAENRQLGCLGL